MGCFCRRTALAPVLDEEEPEREAAPEATQQGADGAELVSATQEWLAARWLPAPPWQPDPEWLDAEVPDAPMEPEAMAVVMGLFQAQQACIASLAEDPAEPEAARRIARIVGTLNRRTQALQDAVRDPRPWERLATLNEQADAVQEAVSQGLFARDKPRETEAQEEEPVAPWRPLLRKVKALAPLLAVAQWQQVDLSEPEAAEALAETVRKLRRVALPPVEDPPLLLRLIARNAAIARLKESFGADPRTRPFAAVEKAVARKVQAAAESLPEAFEVVDGKLAGAPPMQPNPGRLFNADVLQAVRKAAPQTLEKMRWQAPPADQLPLMTTGTLVAALVDGLGRIGTSAVRSGPCDAGAA